MFKLEKIFGLLAIVAIVLKWNMLPGGNIMLLLSLSLLSLLYYGFGFALFNRIGFKQLVKKESYTGISMFMIIIAVITGIALSVICIGIPFKVLRLSGSKILFVTGLIPLLIVFIISVISYFKTKSKLYIRLIKRILIIGGLGLLLSCVSGLTIVKIQYRNHPNYIKAYELYMTNPSDEQLRKNLDIEYYKSIMSDEEFEQYLKQMEEK
ncbi:MAG: hypothetical protein BWY27_01043 [Bacteroidetes bacterium ADurb.Bin234]|jgi:hypothetical protein|nr:MAG: hypothetical protein BWY27_01043 [Bacteroidetes bacterium ADurb.Bin234]